MKISFAIIAKNEEEIIAHCLESIKGADEIVVVDTGSTDRTIEIAKQFTDNIFHFEWCDDFAAARNFAISKCTGDWVQSIDCDHWMMNTIEEVRAEAERAEAEGHRSAFVGSMHKGEKFSHWGTTLFKREGSFWTGKVHEYLTPRPTTYSKLNKGIGYSGNHFKDPDRNLRILLSYEDKGPRQMFYLGREYYERREYEKAIEWLEQYLKLGTWSAEIAEAQITIARCYWNLQEGDKARDMCLKSIRTNPDFKEALLFMSVMHYEPWKHKWQRLADAATNEDVLFLRT